MVNPRLSLSQQIGQLVLYGTVAEIVNDGEEPYVSYLSAGIGGVWWQGGTAAAALLLTPDWQRLSERPLLIGCDTQTLLEGLTPFPPVQVLAYQTGVALESATKLARFMADELLSVGINLIGIPPLSAWSQDPFLASTLLSAWQQAVIRDPICLAMPMTYPGIPLVHRHWELMWPIEWLATALDEGVSLLISHDPLRLIEQIHEGVDGGLIARSTIEHACERVLAAKKSLFPTAEILAGVTAVATDAPAIPPLGDLLGDDPSSIWGKVLTPPRPWQRWHSAAATTFALQLALDGIRSKGDWQPTLPDCLWIWSPSPLSATAPVVDMPRGLDIPVWQSSRLSHGSEALPQWRDRQRILVQWFVSELPPWLPHWLHEHEAQIWGMVCYGSGESLEELGAWCQQHGIPYIHTFDDRHEVQAAILSQLLRTNEAVGS